MKLREFLHFLRTLLPPPFRGPVTEAEKARYRRRRIILTSSMVGAVAAAVVFTGSYFALEYTESPEFCGSCHPVMEPEFIAYEQSPHARVKCVECHIGEGASWLVKSKLDGLRQVWAVATHTYSTPIQTPVHNLRPARETCERCHWPERFSGDLTRLYQHFYPDEENSESTLLLVFRVGSGAGEEAHGIHWHVAAKVWYLPLDEKRQEIGWLAVEREDGTLIEYYDTERQDEITPERIEAEKRLMDCIDCHNRATHIFRSPDELLDEALALGRIDRTLPYIKRLGLDYLNYANPTPTEELGQVVEAYYRTYYPEVYAEKREAVLAAIKQFEEMAKLVFFPDMKVSWMTHPNNLGHQTAPGCFRCHGKLKAQTTDGEGAVVQGRCDLCHYFLPPQALERE